MATEQRGRELNGQYGLLRHPRRSRLLRGDLLAAMAFISPWIIGFAWFQLYPIAASFYYSFTSYNMMQPPHFIGMETTPALTRLPCSEVVATPPCTPCQRDAGSRRCLHLRPLLNREFPDARCSGHLLLRP